MFDCILLFLKYNGRKNVEILKNVKNNKGHNRWKHGILNKRVLIIRNTFKMKNNHFHKNNLYYFICEVEGRAFRV